MAINRGNWRSFPMLALVLLTSGCGVRDSAILDPAGPIASDERDLIVRTSAIMLIVVIPVIILTIRFAWRFRASNEKAPYAPNWDYSGKVDAITWAIPILIVAGVGYHAWVFTHSLDPYKPIQSSQKTLVVHAVAQDWKWLFLYPEQKIAVANELVFPSGAPLSVKITSDTVMNSFFIPGLGGQIYAMAGMRTELNLLSYDPGEFSGRNVMYSGDGFSDQHFKAVAAKPDEFEAWVEKVRRSPDKLDADAYARLAKPGVLPKPQYFSSFMPGLFETIIGKYRAGGSDKHRAMRK